MKTNSTKASFLVVCAIRRQAAVIANGLLREEQDAIENAELDKLHAHSVYMEKVRQSDSITRAMLAKAFRANS